MSGNNSSTGGYLTPTSAPPADDAALDTILHDLIVGVTGLDNTLVFPRWQPQQPTRPAADVNWAAVGVISDEPPFGYWPAQTQVDNNNLQQKQYMRMEVLATFYGPASGGYAKRFFNGMTIRQNLEVIGTFGIKLEHMGRIMHVPELINTQWIGRSDVSLWLVREVDETYAIQVVDTAVVQTNNLPTGSDVPFADTNDITNTNQ